MIAIFLRHSWYLTLRLLRRLYRQPWYVAFTLVQPMIWMLLFGQLFQRVVEIPGFGVGRYVDFLVPGIVVMSALFTSGWSGMGMIDAIDRGVMDRFLVSPVRRAALIVAPLSQTAIVVLLQSLIIVAIGMLVGARFAGGAAGVIVLIVCAVLLAAAFGALSNGLALLARREETVIAAVNFIALPLMFLSPVLMQRHLTPEWIQRVIGYNPVAWAVEAGREALAAGTDWSFVFARVGMLFVAVIVCAAFATRAFRVYQRSV